MPYDTKAKQRWGLKNVFNDSAKVTFIAQMGDYDVLHDETNECYTIVKERPTNSRTHNFTDYYLRDGTLEPNDGDVPLDPYHMCLLYQLHEEVGHTLNIEDCEDN